MTNLARVSHEFDVTNHVVNQSDLLMSAIIKRLELLKGNIQDQIDGINNNILGAQIQQQNYYEEYKQKNLQPKMSPTPSKIMIDKK